MLFAIIGLGRKDGCPRLALTPLLLSVQRDPPPPGLTLVELLPVSTVWGRQWYFIVLKLIGRRKRSREENTKTEGEEAGSTAGSVDYRLVLFNGCFQWLGNDTRNFTKAEYEFQCIITGLQCSDMDNYGHYKENPLFFFCITAISWIIKHYPLHDLEITCLLLLFALVCFLFVFHQLLQVIIAYLLGTTH